MFSKKIRSFTITLLLLAILFISILALTNALIQMPSVQKALIDRIAKAIEYDIRTGEIELDLWRGIGILIHDFDARSKNKNNAFSASSVRITLDARELISGHIVPSDLHICRPKIDLVVKDELNVPTSNNVLSIKKLPFFWIQGIQSMLIEQGEVNFVGISLQMEKLYLDARKIKPSPPTLMLKSHGMIGFKGKKAQFDLSGTILQPLEDGVSPSVDIILKTGKAPLNWITWPKSLPVKQGSFESRLEIKWDIKGKTLLNGRIDVTSLKFSLLRRDRHKDFLIPKIAFDFQSVIEGGRIRFQPLKMTTQDVSMDLGLLIDLKEKDSAYIDLSAKSDFMSLEEFKNISPFPLVAAWVENELFSIFDHGDIKLDFFSLKGNTAQFKNMRIPENRSVLALGLVCRNLEASGNGIQIPFQEISGNITLKDGDFQVSGLGARFGNSQIRDSGLDIKGFLTHSPHFEIFIGGSFDIQELISQEEMSIMPTGIRRSVDKIRGLEGHLECLTRIGYERGWESPKIMKGEFFFTDCSLDKKGLLLPLVLKEAEINIDETNHNSFRGVGLWGNTSFNAIGAFIIEGKRLEIQGADISADMDMNQVIPAFSKWQGPRLKFNRPLPLHISMVKKDDYWSCLGNITLDGMTLGSEGFSVEPPGYNNSVDFDLDIKPYDRIKLKDVICRLSDSFIELSGEYDMQKNEPIQFNIRSSSLSAEDIGIHIKKDGLPASGKIDADLKVSLSKRDGSGVDVIGQLEGKDFYFRLGILSSPISDCSFKLSFSGKRAQITDCLMNLGRGMVTIDGEIKGWNSLVGNIAIKSDFLDVSNILTDGDSSATADKDKGHGRFIRDMDIGIDLDISAGRWRKLIFEQMIAKMNLRDRGLYIGNFSVDLAHGTLMANGHAITGKEPEIFFSGDIRLAEQPIDELLEALGMENKGMKGTLNLEARITMTGKEKEDLVPSLAGKARFSLNQGLLKQSRVIINVLDFLSLQNIYKNRPPELKGEGFYFENMTADITIDKGILSTENYVMKSPVFNAVGYGKAEIPSRSIDFVLGTQPHETIDDLIGMIPILGYIIQGEKESILLYSFKIKGPFSNPDVSFVPFENLGDGIGGILKRLLLSPIKILKDINNAVKDTKKSDSTATDQ
jgi:hypothetical protein